LSWLLLIGGLTATFAFAKPGVVKTRDGKTYDGEVNDSDPDTVVVTVRGIPTRIARNRIASIDYGGADYQKQFAEKMAKLGPNDVEGRLALAKDAFNQKQYPLARQAAESARMIDPNNADAVSMLDTIQSQMRLERARGQGVAEATRPAPATNEAASTLAARMTTRLITRSSGSRRRASAST
jgi:thioredoxin-like negative regulator of GroEL